MPQQLGQALRAAPVDTDLSRTLEIGKSRQLKATQPDAAQLFMASGQTEIAIKKPQAQWQGSQARAAVHTQLPTNDDQAKLDASAIDPLSASIQLKKVLQHPPETSLPLPCAGVNP